MTMLASAGIYLVLDVNSPLSNHHLNRYEPWTSYNLFYFENVFKIVQQFSFYNNTLGFLAGNEVINDPISASVSAPYIKAIIRDIKHYVSINSPRPIPVGYSAADDLNYRIPLAKYLECADNNLMESVDFYGVNSYQWCGDQTFYSSGYNILVNDYKGYSKPVFFSEYGCNEVLPRNFDEVPILYTNDMIDVFNGGLVYEFTQEANNYGLVEILPNGDVKLLRDFLQLKHKFESIPELDYNFIVEAMKENAKEIQMRIKQSQSTVPKCEVSYQNLDISRGVPDTIVDIMIDTGVNVERGKFVHLNKSEMQTKNIFYQPNGEVFNTVYEIDVVVDFEIDDENSNDKQRSHKSGTYNPQDVNDDPPNGKEKESLQSIDPNPETHKESPSSEPDQDDTNEHDEEKPNVIVETFHKVTDSVKNFWASIFT
ncbi:unnamed protein product [Candida parapsilosis]|nr:unnamed protein product [Candida parapsilosis]